MSNKCTRNSNKKKSNSAIPLHYAAMNGSLETCMLLWEHFDEKNVPDTTGRTPLHYAAKHGQLDVYNFILANADEKKPLDIWGHTPISYAKISTCRCHNRKFIGKPQCKKAIWVLYFRITSLWLYQNAKHSTRILNGVGVFIIFRNTTTMKI